MATYSVIEMPPEGGQNEKGERHYVRHFQVTSSDPAGGPAAAARAVDYELYEFYPFAGEEDPFAILKDIDVRATEHLGVYMVDLRYDSASNAIDKGATKPGGESGQPKPGQAPEKAGEGSQQKPPEGRPWVVRWGSVKTTKHLTRDRSGTFVSNEEAAKAEAEAAEKAAELKPFRVVPAKPPRVPEAEVIEEEEDVVPPFRARPGRGEQKVVEEAIENKKQVVLRMGRAPLQGVPVVNSAGQPFDPPIEVPCSHPTVTITAFFAVADPAKIRQYMDRVNDKPFLGWPKDTARCTEYTITSQYEQGRFFWEVQVTVEFNEEGWNPVRLLDAGTMQRVKRNVVVAGAPVAEEEVLVVIPDRLTGHPVSSPVPLNGFGKALLANEEFVYLKFQGYFRTDFNEILVQVKRQKKKRR